LQIIVIVVNYYLQKSTEMQGGLNSNKNDWSLPQGTFYPSFHSLPVC